MDTAPPSALDVIRRVASSVMQRLPQRWTVVVGEPTALSRNDAEAWADVTAPDGTALRLVFFGREQVEPRDTGALAERALARAEAQESGPVIPIVAGRYLSAGARDLLAGHGVGYADATGNLALAADRPALFLRDVGAQRDPWRGPGRPQGSLRGPSAARLVRALTDNAPPYSLPELVELSGVSVGTAYRMAGFLEKEALIERRPRGPVTAVRWRALLERWSEAYRAQMPPRQSYLQPRGLDVVYERLRDVDAPYVATASRAAVEYAPTAPVRLLTILADDPAALADRLGLRAVDAGANVLLGRPIDPVAYAGARDVDGIRIAAPAQTALDLMIAPGRGPSEAEALLDWMEADEDVWRH